MARIRKEEMSAGHKRKKETVVKSVVTTTEITRWYTKVESKVERDVETRDDRKESRFTIFSWTVAARHAREMTRGGGGAARKK